MHVESDNPASSGLPSPVKVAVAETVDGDADVAGAGAFRFLCQLLQREAGHNGACFEPDERTVVSPAGGSVGDLGTNGQRTPCRRVGEQSSLLAVAVRPVHGAELLAMQIEPPRFGSTCHLAGDKHRCGCERNGTGPSTRAYVSKLTASVPVGRAAHSSSEPLATPLRWLVGRVAQSTRAAMRRGRGDDRDVGVSGEER